MQASQDMHFMLFTRLMTGILFKMDQIVHYVSCSKYASQNMRGRLLRLQQSFWTISCTVNALIAWFTLEILDWRWDLCHIILLQYVLY